MFTLIWIHQQALIYHANYKGLEKLFINVISGSALVTCLSMDWCIVQLFWAVVKP